MKMLVAATLLAIAFGAGAAEVLDLPTRPGVTERLLVLPAPDPKAVAILLTGGNGEIGIRNDGSVERGGNFLVRSRERFVAGALATVVVDVPSDHAAPPFLDGDFRASAEHAADLGAVVRWARERFHRPVWLIGTSRGTQSAAAAALQLQGDSAPDGLVLTSTILGRNARSPVTAPPVLEMDLAKLRQPLLVVHHAQDPCSVCDPLQLSALMATLPAGSAVLKTYSGGISVGPPCEARSHHGFNGIEDRVVADIATWIGAH